MFDLLPPQDVGDPKAYLAAIAAILAGYPEAVQEMAVIGVPTRSSRPSLELIKSVCDELYEPMLRDLERAERTKSRFRALPRPPRSPAEQAAIDAQVAAVRKEFGIPDRGLDPKPVHLPPSADAKYHAPVHQPRADGKHALRVQAELDARRARRETESQTE